MTWDQFKEAVENAGIKGDDEIDCIDCVSFDKINVTKDVKKREDGTEYIEWLQIEG